MHSVACSIVATMMTAQSIDPPIPRLEKLGLFPKEPQSFFKALFIETKLGETLKKMTLSKAVPEGLKPQECECGSGRNKPPIPYIPEKDELQEAVESGTSMIKLTLPGKVELRVSVWTSSTQEQFIMHVQQAISAIRQKGLKDAYNGPLRTRKEHKTKLQDANLQVDFASEDQEKAHLEQAAKTATTAYEKAKAEMALVTEQVFQLYSSLIAEKLGSPGPRSCKSR